MNVSQILTTAGLFASAAEPIVQATTFFVQQAETVSPAATGPTKLAAVKAALESFIKASYPALADSFDALWAEVQILIASLVALYNSIGFFKTSPKTA